MQYKCVCNIITRRHGAALGIGGRRPLRLNAKMSPWARRKMAMQFLYAMNFLHRRGVCHRDLSYRNVLVHTYRGSDAFMVKVSDFGLAKEKTSDLTSTGSAMKGSIIDPALGVVQGLRPGQRHIRGRLHPQLHPHRQGEPCHRWIATGLHHPEMLGHQPRRPVSDGEGHHRGYEKDGMPRRIKTGPGGRK